MLLHDWVALARELMLGSKVVERVDCFTYVLSFICTCGVVCDEILARVQNARLAFTNLRHLQRRRDIRLPAKGRVYCTAETTLEVMPAMVENLGWKDIEGSNVMNIPQHDPIMVVSVYTKTVDYTLSIMKSFTLIGAYYCCNTNISIICHPNALVITVIYTINNNNHNCLYVSICMATSFGFWNAQLDAIVKLSVFGISLVLFTCGLLIGAAIKTDLADHITSIVLSLMVISVVTMIVAVVLSIWYHLKYCSLMLEMGHLSSDLESQPDYQKEEFIWIKQSCDKH
ncbi:unnamed protein product [Schistosoma margrebowiei]|uniref:Uncharacterized protein n=1 Tax=Schistosoma margrebowiei TaxID=48269 RepID=A0A183LZH9_9TREM|nr:unnamed protein product [Schistosoma margrebowiei]